VSLLDTASARVAISQHAVPPEVDDARRRIEALETELAIIARETAVGVATAERERSAREKRQAEQVRLQELEVRWEKEKELVGKILDIRARLRGDTGKVEAPPARSRRPPTRRRRPPPSRRARPPKPRPPHRASAKRTARPSWRS